MRRCWGVTRNFRRCGRYGDWTLFCHDHRLQPIKAVSVLLFTVLTGIASIQSAWFPELFNTPRSRVSVGAVLLSKSREGAGGFWLCRDYRGQGRTLAPVNFAAFISLENLSKQPMQIASSPWRFDLRAAIGFRCYRWILPARRFCAARGPLQESII